jgi:hypothetical protein
MAPGTRTDIAGLATKDDTARLDAKRGGVLVRAGISPGQLLFIRQTGL